MDDPRFARIKRDPRFKSLPKKELKTKLNKKFNAVLKDPKFSTKPRFDIYGNKRKQESEFKDHYEEESEEQIPDILEDEEQLAEQSQEKQQSESEVQSEQEEEEESSEDEASVSSVMDKWEEEEQDYQQVPIVLQATKRLALQNYDWQQIKAKDLFVLFSSFLPQGASITQVSVYISDFGKEKMAEEQEFGPRSIFKENFKPSKQKDEVDIVNELIVKGHDDNLDVDPIKLRQYEKDRLKYYYAVIECESPKTADIIYQQTNGQEFELTNIKIDLRFIPNDTVLPNQNLQSTCSTLPSHVTLNNTVNRAVGHTDVRLTWEDSKPRTNFWNKNAKNFNKEDFEEIMGNYESEDEDKIKEDVQELLKKARENDDEEVEDWRASFKNKKQKSNIKVTFQSGFNPNGNNEILDRMPQKKRNNAPREGRIDDFFIGFDGKNKDQDSDKEGRPEEHLNYLERKKQRKQQLKEKRQSHAELALLVDDDKKIKAQFNPNDKRFEAIYTKPDYAIDPTNKQFKSGQNFDEQVQRKKQKLF